LTSRNAGWTNHTGPFPIIEGTVIHVRVERLPGNRKPKPMWLWHSNPNPDQLDLPIEATRRPLPRGQRVDTASSVMAQGFDVLVPHREPGAIWQR
jgi:hypothetical protein